MPEIMQAIGDCDRSKMVNHGGTVRVKTVAKPKSLVRVTEAADRT
jgi:hypothetical protein